MDVDAPSGVPPSAPSGRGRRAGPRGRVRSPRDLLGGAGLVALATFALTSGAGLEGGSLRAMGPAMVPRAVAVAIGIGGLALVAFSFVRRGPPLGRWPLRGPLFVSLAVVAFALTIRTVGLVLAGPLVVIVGGFASAEVRPKELVIFALVITAACVGLFRYLLGLPIPILSVGGFTL